MLPIHKNAQSKELQDVKEELIIFWIEPPWKTSMVLAFPGGHFAIHSVLSQTILKPKVIVNVHSTTTVEAVLISLVQDATNILGLIHFLKTCYCWGHTDISGLCCHLRPWWYPGLYCLWDLCPTVAKVCSNACGLCYRQTLQISRVYSAASIHVDIPGLCCCLRP